MPEIAVLMYAQNAETTIGIAVKSIQRQTFHNWQLLILDNGSQDKTALRAAEAGYGDARVRVFHVTEGRFTRAAAKNELLRMGRATGAKFLTWQEASAVSLPERLERLRHLAIYTVPSPSAAGDAFGSAIAHLDPNGALLVNPDGTNPGVVPPRNPQAAHDALLEGRDAGFLPTMLLRANSVCETFTPAVEDEDLDFLRQLLNGGVSIHNTSEPLYLTRLYQGDPGRTLFTYKRTREQIATQHTGASCPRCVLPHPDWRHVVPIITPDTFLVTVPVHGDRPKELEKALASVQQQSAPDWKCLIVDDRASAETVACAARACLLDDRFRLVQLDQNYGGVAATEVGVRCAVENGFCYWTRLGSDDWWERDKLSRDGAALGPGRNDAVYGPYRVWRDGAPAEVCNGPDDPESIRAGLLYEDRFAPSWANFAVRVEVLARVAARFGQWFHPALRNMEDHILNARIVAVGADWIFRGSVGRPDAYWRAAESASASADGAQTLRDLNLTKAIIRGFAT